MVRAIHRFHGKLVSFARGDSEKIIFEFIPVTACFIKILFGNVRNLYFLVAIFFSQFPDEIIQEVSEKRPSRGPERQTATDEIGKHEQTQLAAEALDLFVFSDLVGSGLPLWTPRGTLLRN